MVTECFLTCSWRFLRYDKLEQFKFKLEKIIEIEKHAGKVRKNSHLKKAKEKERGGNGRVLLLLNLGTLQLFFVVVSV